MEDNIIKLQREVRLFWIAIIAVTLFVQVGAISSDVLIPYLRMPVVAKYLILVSLFAVLIIINHRLVVPKQVHVLGWIFFIEIFSEILRLGNAYDLNVEVRYIFTVCISWLALIIALQPIIKDTINITRNALTVMMILVVVLTVITFLNIYLRLNDFWGLKDQLQLAIGGSNFIECWIIMLTAFCVYSCNNSRNAYILFFIGFIGALFTRSKVAALIWAVWFLIYFIKHIDFNIKSLVEIAFIIIGLWIGYSLLNRIQFFDYSINTLNELFSNDSGSRVSAFNGRIELYKKTWNLFNKNDLTFFFGTGMSYSSINNGYAHNYFLQILASQGIIGMFLVIVRYAIIISNLIRNKKDLFSRASLASVVMVFINSMYEPCIGEFCFNMIYWFIIGIGLARCYEDILDTTE